MVLSFDRSSHRYRSQRDDQAFLRHRIREIAASRVRYGYSRIWIALRREGLKVNHKRVRRLYREEGLNLRIKRPRRHVSAAHRAERTAVTAPNEVWSMDFVFDRTGEGRVLKCLTIVDDATHEAVAIEVARAISGQMLTRVLDRLERRGYNVFESRPSLGAADALVIAWNTLLWRETPPSPTRS